MRQALAVLCLLFYLSEGWDEFFGNPAGDLRADGVSRSPSFRSVGLIQSEEKPMICSRSLPLNHLMPTVGDCDNVRAAAVDTRNGDACKQSMVGFFFNRASRAR